MDVTNLKDYSYGVTLICSIGIALVYLLATYNYNKQKGKKMKKKEIIDKIQHMEYFHVLHMKKLTEQIEAMQEKISLIPEDEKRFRTIQRTVSRQNGELIMKDSIIKKLKRHIMDNEKPTVADSIKRQILNDETDV